MKEEAMEHHWFEDRISAWLDQGLPVMEQAALDEHVATCAACQEQADRFRSLDRLVQRHANLNTDHVYFNDLAAKTNERIFGSDRKSDGEKTVVTPISWMRWTAVAAGVILTSVVSWKVFEEQPKVRQLSAPAVESTRENDLRLVDSIVKKDESILFQDVSTEKSADTLIMLEGKITAPTAMPQHPVASSPIPVVDGIASETKDLNGTSLDTAGSNAKKVFNESSTDTPLLESPVGAGITDSAFAGAREELGKVQSREGEKKRSASPPQSSPTSESAKSASAKGDLKDLSSESAPRNFAAPRLNAFTADSSAIFNIRRLLQSYRAETDTTLQRAYRDSLQAAVLQHPQLPTDLTQQLDSLGFSR